MEPVSIEERIAHAHHLGKDKALHKEAAEILSSLAQEAKDPEVRAACAQQAGVYLANAGDHEGARDLYRVAMRLTGNTQVQANIERDDSRSAAALGNFEEAFDLIGQAIDRRSHTKVERYIDIGFRGRIKCQVYRSGGNQALLESGLVDLRLAHAVLRDKVLNPDRNLELYNLLHLAEAQSLSGRRRLSRQSCLRALTLMAWGRLHGPQAGNREHIARAVLLLIGGWRLEEWGRRLRKSK